LAGRRRGRYSPSEHTLAGEFPNDPAKVLKVPCQTVHRVNHQRAAIPHVLKRTGQPGTIGVLAAGFVSEHLVQLDSIELTDRVL
jgi:hypothetical protein